MPREPLSLLPLHSDGAQGPFLSHSCLLTPQSAILSGEPDHSFPESENKLTTNSLCHHHLFQMHIFIGSALLG